MTHYLFRSGDPTLSPVLLLHSTGGDETELLDLAHYLLSDHPLLAIRGRVLEEGKPRYFERYREGEFNLGSLEKEANWLAREISQLSAQFSLDVSKMTVIAYSNGANMALHLALNKEIHFARIIAFHAMLLSPVTEPRKSLEKTPIFLSFGESDPLVSKANLDQLLGALNAAGAAISLHQEKGGHALNHREVAEAERWLSQTP